LPSPETHFISAGIAIIFAANAEAVALRHCIQWH
jgi:hypothetical protein